jgi:predicted porin
MKKTLIALAALTAASAFAADSVTIYGIADSWFGQTKGNNGINQTVVQSGGLSTSRLGFSIKEDLGDGMGAFAVIEDQINMDDGTKGAQGRKYVVGLSGDFGAVSLGRQPTPYEDFYLKSFYTMDNSSFEGMKIGGRAAGYAHTARIDNGVRYDSPNFDGFTASLHLGLGENKTATVRATKTQALSARYANGPVIVGLAYQKDEAQAGVLINSTTNTVVAGSYDFGAAKVNLGYNMAKKSNLVPKENTYNLGVVVPFGAFSLLAEMGQSKVSNGGIKTKSFGLEGRYALSKRTTVYAGLGQAKISGAVNPNRRNIGVGIRHTF